jgi:hypothetical protein
MSKVLRAGPQDAADQGSSTHAGREKAQGSSGPTGSSTEYILHVINLHLVQVISCDVKTWGIFIIR